MAGPAWNDDPPDSRPRIIANISSLGPDIEAAAARRDPPSVDAAREWHRRIYAGLELPVAYYAGEVRDSDRLFPALDGYEVRVGTARGVASAQVPAELARFERACRSAVASLGATILASTRPANEVEMRAVIRLCAYTHGEWIRIHPFANGNGRTARIWANAFATRYGLPAFVAIKPRPDDLAYRASARASMAGDHGPTEALFLAMLRTMLRAHRAPGP